MGAGGGGYIHPRSTLRKLLGLATASIPICHIYSKEQNRRNKKCSRERELELQVDIARELPGEIVRNAREVWVSTPERDSFH